jgi:hypothetical protein
MLFIPRALPEFIAASKQPKVRLFGIFWNPGNDPGVVRVRSHAIQSSSQRENIVRIRCLPVEFHFHVEDSRVKTNHDQTPDTSESQVRRGPDWDLRQAPKTIEFVGLASLDPDREIFSGQ